MKKALIMAVFMLAALPWALAQQTGSMPDRSGQATSPGSQMPSAQSPSTQAPSTQAPGAQAPGSAGQQAPQAGVPEGSQTPAAAEPVTEGCLGGSNPNFTITDKAGTTYKLIIPPNSDASALNSHVGESVKVMGAVNNAGAQNSIDVSKVGRGTGNCAGSATGAQTPNAQPPKKQ